MHRVLHVISVTLITAGLVVLADVALTLVWKEPVSSVYGSLRQGEAEEDLAALERRFPSEALLRQASDIEDVEARAAFLADAFEREAKRGAGIGRIAIPAIDLDIVVVEGTDSTSLQRGPGHYTGEGLDAGSGIDGEGRGGDGSAFPGQGRTVGIAGHRTTYLAPFRRIDEIEKGDEITVTMPYATFVYRVEKSEIVSPDDVDVVRDVGFERLVLTACHPLYSAAQRYVQFARLEEVSLFATSQRRWQDP